MRLIQMIDRYARLYASDGCNRYQYASFYDLVADQGCSFTPVDRPKNVKRGIPQHCYYNATCEAKRRIKQPYLYCEGYYLRDDIGFPVAHAWLTDRDCKIAIDPTLSYDPALNPQYFGVTLSLDFIKWHQKISRACAIFESDYMHRYQLLREGFPDGAVLNASELQTLKQQARNQRLKLDPGLRPAEVLLHLSTTLHEVAKSC